MCRFRPLLAIFAVCVVMAFSAVTAQAGTSYFDKIKAKETIKFGLNASYPPFALWTEKGPIGFDVELARNMAKALGIEKYEFVKVKPNEAADMLVKGEVDIVIAALSLTPDRLKKVAFSIPYITVTHASLLSRGKIPQVIIGEVLRPMPVESYNDLAKLEPLRIGVKEGTATYEKAKKKFTRSKIITFPDAESLSKAFLDGQVDAVIHEDPFVRHFAQVNKSKGRQFVALTKNVSEEGLCVVYRYGDPDFARFLDGYIRYLQQTNMIEKWERMYFDDSKWMEGAK